MRNLSNVGRKVSLLPLGLLFDNLGSRPSSLPALRGRGWAHSASYRRDARPLKLGPRARPPPWIMRESAAMLHAPRSPAAKALLADTRISTKGAALVHVTRIGGRHGPYNLFPHKMASGNSTLGHLTQEPQGPLHSRAPGLLIPALHGRSLPSPPRAPSEGAGRTRAAQRS